MGSVFSLWSQYFDIIVYMRDRLCGPVVRVPGYKTEMYCDSCEVQTEFIHEYDM
jgi:hypothetical protein